MSERGYECERIESECAFAVVLVATVPMKGEPLDAGMGDWPLLKKASSDLSTGTPGVREE